MKRVLFVIILLFLYTFSFAQSLNGVVFGFKVFETQEEVSAAQSALNPLTGAPQLTLQDYVAFIKPKIEALFGTGESIDCSLLSEWGVVTAIYPGGDEIEFEDGRLSGFDLETSRFLSAEDIFDGGVRIGFPAPASLKVSWAHLQGVSGLFNNAVEVPNQESPFKYHIENGIIVRICMPLLLM